MDSVWGAQIEKKLSCMHIFGKIPADSRNKLCTRINENNFTADRVYFIQYSICPLFCLSIESHHSPIPILRPAPTLRQAWIHPSWEWRRPHQGCGPLAHALHSVHRLWWSQWKGLQRHPSLKNLYLQILTTSSMPPVTINSSGSPAGGGEPTASKQLFNVHPKICLKQVNRWNVKPPSVVWGCCLNLPQSQDQMQSLWAFSLCKARENISLQKLFVCHVVVYKWSFLVNLLETLTGDFSQCMYLPQWCNSDWQQQFIFWLFTRLRSSM